MEQIHLVSKQEKFNTFNIWNVFTLVTLKLLIFWKKCILCSTGRGIKLGQLSKRQFKGKVKINLIVYLASSPHALLYCFRFEDKTIIRATRFGIKIQYVKHNSVISSAGSCLYKLKNVVPFVVNVVVVSLT